MDVDIEQQYKAWLTLASASGIGSASAKKLIDKLGTPQNIIACEHNALLAHGLSETNIKSLKSPQTERIDRALTWLEKPGHHLITLCDSDYPELLKQIDSCPIVLFAIGQRSVLKNIHFAIVGSRNPSSSGKKISENFSCELARLGLTICSGLALGIDYYSHLGALRAERPTVAVLGNGLDQIYPARHKKIAAEITEQGLLLSEFFLGVKPHPGNFPRRNRIISGMSTGVLVVEAAKRSGSLITANYALEQGREVFAIPGSIHNPLAKGTHSLIKQGAKLVETTSDIVEELMPVVKVISDGYSNMDLIAKNYADLDTEYKKLLDIMGYDEVNIDYLVGLTGLTAEVVSSMLLVLELRGIVESRNSGKYCRCP